LTVGVGVVVVVKVAKLDRLLVVTCALPPPRSVLINPAMSVHRQNKLEREREGATRVAMADHATI
jgi:hypothetical protein